MYRYKKNQFALDESSKEQIHAKVLTVIVDVFDEVLEKAKTTEKFANKQT